MLLGQSVFREKEFVAAPPLCATSSLRGTVVVLQLRTRGGGMSIHDRGFASMSKERQLELASRGGKAVHQRGTAHEWTTEEAHDAARKAALARAQKRDGKHAGEVSQRENRNDGTIPHNMR
jgi:uncharacterized protein